MSATEGGKMRPGTRALAGTEFGAQTGLGGEALRAEQRSRYTRAQGTRSSPPSPPSLAWAPWGPFCPQCNRQLTVHQTGKGRSGP